jgi:hypothetical protein
VTVGLQCCHTGSCFSIRYDFLILMVVVVLVVVLVTVILLHSRV